MSSDSVLHQLVDGTFVGPIAPRTDQPKPTVVPIDWNAYDVPRLWDAMRREDNEIAWQQVRGFENLAQLLLSHHDSLKQLRNALAGGWDPATNPTATIFFSFLDELIRSMAEDAVAHASTSRGLHGTLTALRTAKVDLAQLKQEWDRVTTDWVPEWWDHAADELNQRARRTMVQTEQAVADHRHRMIVPTLYTYPAVVSQMQVPTTTSTRSRRSSSFASAPGATPPPMPGYDPVPNRGPDLQGIPNVPQPVPAVPGSPISLLPVPPGNPYAPGGGAYVLPGPGIGRGGWIYPMPTPPAQARGSSQHGPRASSFSPTASTRPTGAAPTAMPLGATAGHSGRDGRRTGKRNTVWEVAQGVPPVIGEIPADVALAEEQRQQIDEAFVDWFADLATPWSYDLKVNLGQRTEPTS